ncbi:MAG: TPM domain-containing protein [Candidatus Cloacimonetes bacterium]|nr:TPM domain-containing protein [Candidatus Cloacimonadota bacterium]
MQIRKLVIFLLLTLLMLPLLAKLRLPELKMMVNDEAGILSRGEEQELESLLRTVKDRTSSEVVLLTITSLQGLTIEEYGIRLADEWKVGKADRDNGLILLVSTGDRKVRLEVGYGLEGILTDARCSYIINESILPAFRSNNYYEGIKAGLSSATGLITGEYIISDEELAAYQEKQQRKRSSGGIPVGLIIFILFLLLSRRRGGGGGIFSALLLGSMLGGHSGRGGMSGGGGFGGFSGGGGGFGGGGASGGW